MSKLYIRYHDLSKRDPYQTSKQNSKMYKFSVTFEDGVKT